MYKIFIKNLEGFEKIFKNDERLNIARPLYLLKDLAAFDMHKNQNTNAYQNLCAIIEKAEEFKMTSKYYGFGMFLNELGLQFMFPAYYS